MRRAEGKPSFDAVSVGTQMTPESLKLGGLFRVVPSGDQRVRPLFPHVHQTLDAGLPREGHGLAEGCLLPARQQLRLCPSPV